ncbi:hypothetical protein PTT_19716 [Pyrenophora teres f. teres 0-1]|uniref:Uncharacterized protein n=1 Tax=Pyrenophora teres f. teres (strain 0-1) TaxID=861557 RepID=E3S9I5_PYRTT|nr:hypothetical protein PTT_19716 [Pyrenophora teres f. teres 0-1]
MPCRPGVLASHFWRRHIRSRRAVSTSVAVSARGPLYTISLAKSSILHSHEKIQQLR